jgi:hypothetical protein
MILSVNFWLSRRGRRRVFALDLLSEVGFPLCCFRSASRFRAVIGRRRLRYSTAGRRPGDRQTLVAVLGVWMSSEMDIILVVHGMELRGEERGRRLMIGMRHGVGSIVRVVLDTTQVIRLQGIGRSTRRRRVVSGGLVRKCSESRGIGVEEGRRESEVGSGLGSWIQVVDRMPHTGDILIVHFVRLLFGMLQGIVGREMLFLEPGYKVRRRTTSRFIGPIGKVSGTSGKKIRTGW